MMDLYAGSIWWNSGANDDGARLPDVRTGLNANSIIFDTKVTIFDKNKSYHFRYKCYHF